MKKEDILEEINMCNGILAKFKEEMLSCEKDKNRLQELLNNDSELKNDIKFKKAFVAVKQRYEDIELSVKLIKGRLTKLKEDLKSVE